MGKVADGMMVRTTSPVQLRFPKPGHAVTKTSHDGDMERVSRKGGLRVDVSPFYYLA